MSIYDSDRAEMSISDSDRAEIMFIYDSDS